MNKAQAKREVKVFTAGYLEALLADDELFAQMFGHYSEKDREKVRQATEQLIATLRDKLPR